MLKVVLPIAALLAILITTGGAPVPFFQGAPTGLQGAPAHAAEPSPVAFDPFTGWGVTNLQRPPVAHSQVSPAAFDDLRALPFVEVDPFDRYGVNAPPARLVRAVTGPWDWHSFADLRARYEGAATANDPWWADNLPPLDAK